MNNWGDVIFAGIIGGAVVCLGWGALYTGGKDANRPLDRVCVDAISERDDADWTPDDLVKCAVFTATRAQP